MGLQRHLGLSERHSAKDMLEIGSRGRGGCCEVVKVRWWWWWCLQLWLFVAARVELLGL